MNEDSEVFANNEEVLPWLEEHVEDGRLLDQIIQWGVQRGAELAKEYPKLCLMCTIVRTEIRMEGGLIRQLIFSTYVVNDDRDALVANAHTAILDADEDNNVIGFCPTQVTLLN